MKDDADRDSDDADSDSADADSDSDDAPGPGAYFKPTQNSSFIPEGKPERLQFFGSTVERF